jgi:putative glutamine amidotransferase
VAHRQRESARSTTHHVRVLPASRLGRIMGEARAHANSFHHQAVDRLGRGLRAVAWADDGVVEGIETPGPGFTIGVQWHAECLTARAEHAALFSALVDAAERHSRVASERAA